MTRSLIPSLPLGWHSVPAKHAVSLNPEVLPETTLEETALSYVDIAALEGGDAAASLSPKELTFGTAPSRARRVLRAGDTILSTVRTYLKAVANFPEASDGLVASTGFAVFRPNGRLHPRFAYWAALSEPFIENVVAHSEGVSYPAINPSVLGSLHMPMPPRLDQERIANFLDVQTARIDALIAEKERLAERLDEYCLSAITSALSGGAHPKDSYAETGEPWFTAIPADWAFCPLNYRYEIQLGKMLDEKRITGDHLTPYLRNVDVQWGQVNVENLPRMDVHPNERERYTVRPGDLLVCEGGDVGRAAIWEEQPGTFAFQKALHRVRPRTSKDLPKYLFYLLFDSAKRGRFADREKATISHLTAEAFRRYRFPFPPLSEQKEIVKRLDAMMESLSQLRTHVAEHIARLREYRSSLISAAVTGQLDLSTATSNSR